MLSGEFLGRQYCSECKISYKNLLYLRRHAKKFHPEKWQEIAPLRSSANGNANKTFNCDQCHKSYSHKANLTYHIKKVHDVSTSIANAPSLLISTKLEDNNPANLIYQIDQVPDVATSLSSGPNLNEKPRRKCALCDYVAVFKNDFYRHYTYDHNIPIESETLEFATYSEFLSWIDNFEKQSQARFVKQRGLDAIVTNFVCHRAGFYIPESKGRRARSSHNRSGFCPARFKLMSLNDKWFVEIIKTHVGHQNDLGYFYMAFSEREALDAKIKAGVPFDKILDEIRDSVSGSQKEPNQKSYEGKSSGDLPLAHSDEDDDDDHQNVICLDNWTNEVTPSNTIVAQRKEKVLQWFQNIVGNIETEVELDTLEELMNQITATLQTLKQNL